jgi:hypothetical protein
LLLFSDSTSKEVSELIRSNSTSHFFFDEAPVGNFGIPSKTLNELSKQVSSDNYFWIACQSDKPPNPKYLQGKLKC